MGSKQHFGQVLKLKSLNLQQGQPWERRRRVQCTKFPVNVRIVYTLGNIQDIRNKKEGT